MRTGLADSRASDRVFTGPCAGRDRRQAGRRASPRARAHFFVVLAALAACGNAGAELDLRNVQVERLDNGLTVLLLEDRNFPVVSVQMLYRVGARNEVTGRTGLAHFLEHMAFRASENFPDTDVVSRIYAAGGEWHGYTWTDQTTYFATVPKADLNLLLAIEADRMGRLVLDPEAVEAERGAVLAEMHMYENYPTSMLIDALMYTSFLAHPYRNNTIGFESDILALKHADLEQFYAGHYHPANAVLAVVGDMDPDDTLDRIRSLFDHYERRPPTPLPHTAEPVQTGERRIEITGPAAGRRFMIGYRAPSVTQPDFAVFLVLQQLLGGGSGVSFLQNDWGTPVAPSGRLHGAADELTTWYPPSAQDYVFVIGGSAAVDTAAASVEASIETRVRSLRETVPGPAELAAAIAAVRDALVFDVQSTEDAAHQLAFFEGLGALDVLLSLPERVGAVTAADVRRVARAWLGPRRRTVAWYAQAGGQADGPSAANTRAKAAGMAPGPEVPVDTAPVTAPVVRRLAGGLPIVLQASDLAPSVCLTLVLPGSVGADGSDIVAGEPAVGYSTWRRQGRATELPALVAAAKAAVASAAYAADGVPAPATDPEARMEQAFARFEAGVDTAGERPAPALVVLAGDIDLDAATAILARHFGDTVPAAAPAHRAGPGTAGADIVVELGLPVPQARLGYAVAAPAPDDPDFDAWRMLLYLFSHEYEGRFGKEAISRRGLAYYVDARYRSAGGPGLITLSVGVDPNRVGALKRVLRDELARLAAEPPTAAEVGEARDHLLGRYETAAQTNAELADRLALHWIRFGNVPSLDALRSRLGTVQAADLARIVPEFIDGRIIAVVP